ncbi:MAG: 3-deoxy-D-manno-octulosonic acid transferase [Candidatus Omnitrophica bacterium]|nr:3-deoxy-D-manno-octulosonic acid transferase [Candidatus Omnitrophota bacterium]
MTILYDLIFALFAIAYLPYLVFTGRCHRDILQRFGLYPKDIIENLKWRKVIWVHAVSVGEVMAARCFCETLLERYPRKRLVISTITKTGNDIAKKFFRERATILYLPVDISFVLNKVFGNIGLESFIIIETELWPNLITALDRKGVPITLINGRISPKSYRRYRRVRFLIEGLLRKITLFCMQNDEYKERIIDMGAPHERVSVTGNMKFDTAGPPGIVEKLNIEALRGDLGLAEDAELFIAGSTHRPEEEMIIRIYKDLLVSYPRLKLLIAPRHIERASEIEGLIRKFDFNPVKMSNITNGRNLAVSGTKEILVLDMMGRLSQLFSLATLVFMGGSLIGRGGQNILEPAVFSKPIIFGPYMFNFKDIAESFLKEDAACMVRDEDELLKLSRRLLEDSGRQAELGFHARSLIEKNRGATKRNIESIANILT